MRKQDLMRHIQQKGAPQTVTNALQQMPDREYTKMTDVMKAFGEVK